MRSKLFKLASFLVVAAIAGGASLYLHPLVTTKWTSDAVADSGDAFDRTHRAIICSGRVETVDGEVEVAPQIAGRLAEVRVREGQTVEKNEIVAVLDGERQIADLQVAKENVRLAKSRLARLLAGNGAEEIAQSLAAAGAVEAELNYEQRSLERSRRLGAKAVISREELDQKQQRVEQLQQQLASQRMHYEALRRGPLREEVEVARAELTVAEAHLAKANVEHELRFVRAPMAGTVLKLYRHAGDAVSIDQVTPVLRIADTGRLLVRLEIDEADVPLVQPGRQGAFKIRGIAEPAGRLTVQTIVPAFGPKRLFNPDASARHDARTLEVLCDAEATTPLYPGQRVTADFRVNAKQSKK